MTNYERKYKCLPNGKINKGPFALVPIRDCDKSLIKDWRNQQVYHLRQTALISDSDQEHYFKNIVSKLFSQDRPMQILFSFLENDYCIGYGGLVHINWQDRNAELSFVMNTQLEKQCFQKYWTCFLEMIEIVAFDRLLFHKLYTYAFDLRPHLYPALESNGYVLEGRLKDHASFEDGFVDVVYHGKLNVKTV